MFNNSERELCKESRWIQKEGYILLTTNRLFEKPARCRRRIFFEDAKFQLPKIKAYPNCLKCGAKTVRYCPPPPLSGKFHYFYFFLLLNLA